MNWIKKNKKKFWFALLINGALLLLLLLIFRPKYETNDDMGILCMVSGVKLGADAHLVYINYVLGKLLAWCSGGRQCTVVCDGSVWCAVDGIYCHYLCMSEQDREPECDLDPGSAPDSIFL